MLIVVAHPDDEILGCGGTGAVYHGDGHSVNACILSAEAGARSQRPDQLELREDTLRAQELLGFGPPILGNFPNIALNTVPHLALVQFIERALIETGATTIFTHHARDLNDDHSHVSRACQAAARLGRRRTGTPTVTDVLLMETLSSTDWSMPDGREPFDPDTFVPFGEEILEKKIAALMCYKGVTRPRPHSRSEEVIRALATIRGAQCGHFWAEAFKSAFRVMSPARG